MAGRVGVFASPVAGFLLRYGGDAGYWTVLVEPDPERATAVGDLAAAAEDAVRRSYPDGRADVVVTDHHRPELGPMLRDALASDARWVGVMETPGIRPRTSALAELGVTPAEIGRVRRPVSLNIDSKTPAEIATVAGLIADRNGRRGGFSF